MLLFIFIVFWNYMCDKYLPNHSVKIREVINYSLWSLLSLIAEFYYLYTGDVTIYSGFICYFLLISINTTYLYELIRYKNDLAHTLHHIITMILQVYSYYSGFLNSPHIMRMCNTSHKGYISSIVSALRPICKYNNSPYTPLVEKIYYYTYLICKIGGLIAYYWMFVNNIHLFTWDFKTFMCLWLYFLIHCLQMYFSYKIIKKLLKK